MQRVGNGNVEVGRGRAEGTEEVLGNREKTRGVGGGEQ